MEGEVCGGWGRWRKRCGEWGRWREVCVVGEAGGGKGVVSGAGGGRCVWWVRQVKGRGVYGGRSRWRKGEVSCGEWGRQRKGTLCELVWLARPQLPSREG